LRWKKTKNTRKVSLKKPTRERRDSRRKEKITFRSTRKNRQKTTRKNKHY